MWKNDLKDNISVKKPKHNNTAGVFRNSENENNNAGKHIARKTWMFCNHWKLPPAAPILENTPSVYVQVSV